MKTFSSSFFLRFPVIIILLAHSITGMFNNGINDFGNLYLNQIGFALLDFTWHGQSSYLTWPAQSACRSINM